MVQKEIEIDREMDTPSENQMEKKVESLNEKKILDRFQIVDEMIVDEFGYYVVKDLYTGYVSWYVSTYTLENTQYRKTF